MTKKAQFGTPGGEMVIYQAAKGAPKVQITLRGDSLWLSLGQMAEMFDRDPTVIGRHLRNIFKTKELDRKSVAAFFAVTASDGKTYQVEHYNFDAIVSIGYRVNSKKGTQFRIWATQILREYSLQGYAINKPLLKSMPDRYEELKTAVSILKRAAFSHALSSEEARGVLEVIHDFAHALEVLDGYDHESLEITGTSRAKVKHLTYEDAKQAIAELGKQYKSSDLFGREKDASFRSTMATIYQTFDGRELYPSIEEKAANLLYFTVKNHSFVDGNKRIAAFLFVWFLSLNGALYRADGSKRIADNALVALCLMVAESKAQEKDLMVKVVINLINRKN